MNAPMVVAEYGQTMKGSIDVAHQQVEVAAKVGCWGYKTQLIDPATIARLDAPLYWMHGSPVDSQREAFERAGVIEFAAWEEVAEHAARLGLAFVATPFDLAAVDAMASWKVRPVFKVASGDLTNVPLLRAVAKAAAADPLLIVSTGAAYMTEVLEARQVLTKAGVDEAAIVWLACTLAYPTLPADAELERITALRTFSNRTWRVGYSDHVGLDESALGAAVLGAELLEVHCTLDPGNLRTSCPDDVHGLGPLDLLRYVEAAERGAAMRGTGKLGVLASEQPARRSARRSICAARNLEAGTVLAEDDLVCLRPGDGVPAEDWDLVVGLVLLQPTAAGRPLDRAHLLLP